MVHDFVKFPELRNNQMEIYYFESPHKQIVEDFEATVVKVSDGDTIRVETSFRDFDFPIRILDIDTPELNEEGGKETREWLEGEILGENIEVIMDRRQRVGKWGRLLGKVFFRGRDIGDDMIRRGMATPFDRRREDKIPEISEWV